MNKKFPNDLIQQYKKTCTKLQKFQNIVFKRFAPNVSEIVDEFCHLAIEFDNAFLPEYAGNCYLGAAKCEKLIGNEMAEVDTLLKGARMFIKADAKIDDLKFKNRNHLEGALRCYNQALSALPEGSAVMEMAIIRELNKINYHTEQNSNFSSHAHRIYDLEIGAKQNLQHAEYLLAIEKLTESYDIIIERKVSNLYEDLMMRNTISRLLLLLILEIPPSRHSPSYIKLLERYSSLEYNSDEFIPDTIFMLLQGLTMSCVEKDVKTIRDMFNQLSNYLNEEQQTLLLVLYEKYSGCQNL